MSFRLRPSSKKSTDTEHSLVQFPKHTFASNQIMSLKQVINKMEMIQNSFNILSDGIRRQREISSTGYIEVQKRLDVLEYKSFSNEKDIQQLTEMNRASFTSLPPLKKQVLSSSQSQMSKNELIILKQTLLQERQSQRQQSKHMSQSMQQLSMKQLRLQQQLREMFNRNRSQYEDRINAQSSQLQKIDHYKNRKLDNQYQLMRESMQVMEKRIVQQLQSKIRKETVIKDYIHQQLNIVKQQLLLEQKSLISTQTKLTRQTKQSLQSLYSMIAHMKSTFTQELNETQQLTTTNIKRLAMNLDVIDGKYQYKMKQIEQGVKEGEREIVDFRQWVIGKMDQNRDIVMGLEEEAVQRMENSNNRGTSQSGFNNTQLPQRSQQRIKHLQAQLSGWKSSIQQKNLTIFKQIAQSLKQLKLDCKKENDQFSSQLISLTQSLKQVKKSLPNDMKKISQTIVTIFNDQFDVLAEEMDLLTEMIKVGKMQNQKHTRQQLKRSKEESFQEMKTLIQASRKQITLGLQKSLIKTEESFKSSLQKQSSYLQSLFTQRMETLESMNHQLQSQSKKLNTSTNAQLENFTLSMKQFNENYKEYLQQQRKEDLKKRIQLEDNMRKNASNLMQLAYKKSEFLVDGMKKAIEMNQMKKDLQTKQAIQVVKDDLNRQREQQKDQMFTQLKSLEQKLSAERQSSEQQLQDTMKDSVATLKKSLGIEIGNNKLQIDEKIAGLQKEIDQKQQKEKENNKKIQEKLQLVKKQSIDSIQKLKSAQKLQIQKQINNIQSKLQSLTTQIKQDTTQKLKTLNQKTKEQNKNQLNTVTQKLKLETTQMLKIVTQKQQKQQKALQSLTTSIKQQTNQQIKSVTQKQQKAQQRQSQIQKTITVIKKETQEEKAKQKETSQSKIVELEKQLKQDIAKQFEQSAQKSQETLKQYDETLNTLRETVWKLQAMNFSEQAKNKAIFDKLNEDLNHVAMNIDSVTKEIKVEQKKKDP